MTCQTCMGKGSYFIAKSFSANHVSDAVEIQCPDCRPPIPLGGYQTDTFKTKLAQELPPVDPVRAHVAHCASCEICEGWRQMFAETRPRYLVQAGWYDYSNRCFYTTQKDADFARDGGNDVVFAWVPPKERFSHG